VETWLTDKINNESVALNGYDIIRYDRTHKRAGGVCVYYKKCFKLKVVHSSRYGKTEILMTELIIPSMTILVVACYNPPPAVLADIAYFQEFISSQVLNYSHFIICGDLNFNMVGKSQNFHNLLKSNHLISIPFLPTRDSAWLYINALWPNQNTLE
jgi:exonuclease III